MSALFTLIKNLNKAEKGYLKKHSARFGSKDKSYLQLFNQLEKLSHYDEKQFVLKHKTKPWIKHFSANKLYLKNFILDALYNYSLKQNQEHQLYKKWNHFTILKNRGITKEAQKVLSQVKRKATQMEDLSLLIKVIAQEKNFVLQFKRKDVLQRLQKLNEELNDVMRKLQSETQMHGFYYECFALSYIDYGSNKSIKQKLDDLFTDVQSQFNPKADQTSLFWRSRYGFLENYFICKGERKKAFKQLVHLWGIYNENELLQKTQKTAYESFLVNYIKAAIRICAFENADKGFSVLEGHLKKFPSNSLFVIDKYIHFKLIYYKNMAQFDEGITFYNNCLDQFRTLKMESLNPYNIFIVMDLCFIHFGLKEYTKAQQRINQLINHYKDSALNDFLLEIRLMNLLIHFELNNTDFIINQSEAFLRKYNPKKQFRKFETLFVDRLRGLVTTQSRKQKKELTEQFYNELSSLSIEPVEHFIISRLKIQEWIQSKLNGTSLIQELRKTYLKKKKKIILLRDLAD